jgi:hypothetical protein
MKYISNVPTGISVEVFDSKLEPVDTEPLFKQFAGCESCSLLPLGCNRVSSSQRLIPCGVDIINKTPCGASSEIRKYGECGGIYLPSLNSIKRL